MIASNRLYEENDIDMNFEQSSESDGSDEEGTKKSPRQKRKSEIAQQDVMKWRMNFLSQSQRHKVPKRNSNEKSKE